jgi:hypothetical protein
MGYFLRKIRRGECRSMKHSLLCAPVDDAFPLVSEPARGRVLKGQLYLRLAVPEIHPDSAQPAGIFAAAYWLRDSCRCRLDDKAHLRRWLGWFQQNLKIPRDIPPEAIFWFRDDGGRAVRRLWGIVRMLRAHGSPVRLISTREPGRIIYSDDLQIAAIPGVGIPPNEVPGQHIEPCLGVTRF